MSSQALNPYAPPLSDEAPQADATPDLAAAGLWPRFAASFVDLLLLMGPFLGGGYYGLSTPGHDTALGFAIILVLLPILITQWVMLSRRGQSIGKRLLKIKVLALDGSNPGFVRVVVLRSWVLFGFAAALNAVASSPLGSWVFALDALFVFGSTRRCLHDYLAGTRVVRL